MLIKTYPLSSENSNGDAGQQITENLKYQYSIIYYQMTWIEPREGPL